MKKKRRTKAEREKRAIMLVNKRYAEPEYAAWVAHGIDLARKGASLAHLEQAAGGRGERVLQALKAGFELWCDQRHQIHNRHWCRGRFSGGRSRKSRRSRGDPGCQSRACLLSHFRPL